MTRIRVRRGTSAQWTAANPVLGEGELGFETDTGKLKIGNGTTAWTTLAYTSLDWTTLANKPAVIAAGATQADARAAIGVDLNALATLDSNGNVTADAFISTPSVVNFTANNQNVILTANSPAVITVSASGTYSGCVIHLPASGMVVGRQFLIVAPASVPGGFKVHAGGTGIQDMFGSTAIIVTATGSANSPSNWLILGQIPGVNGNGPLVTNSGTTTLWNKNISGLNNTLSNIAISSLAATGTPSSVNFLRGDGTWSGVSLSWADVTGKPVVVAAGATQADARSAIDAEHTGNRGVANGYASLDAAGLVPLGQLPITTADWDTLEGKPAVVAAGVDAAAARAAIDAEYTASKGQANGYASLDADGTVPFAQIPDGVAVDGVTRTDGYLQFLSGDTPVGDPVLLDWDVIDGGSATSVSVTTLDGGTPT